MNNTDTSAIVKAFAAYKDTLFTVDNHMKFWSHILQRFINDFGTEKAILPLYQALFAVYDKDYQSHSGDLVTHNMAFAIEKAELEDERKQFFSWIMNLSILKAYNAAELFLLQAIVLNYFPTLINPIYGKKHAECVHKEICNYLDNNGVKPNKSNNRHIIQFVKLKSIKAASFLDHTMNVDLKTTWAGFFELFSILRNIIIHNSSIVPQDTHNTIKSLAKDIFERHFVLHTDSSGCNILQPDENKFDNFIVQINDFVLNTIKFISGENTLAFLGMTDIFEFYGVKNKKQV
jgi:hypothetical protein